MRGNRRNVRNVGMSRRRFLGTAAAGVGAAAISASGAAHAGTQPFKVWHVEGDGSGDFETIQEAVDSPDVLAGDKIMVGPGEYAGAFVDKPVHLIGSGPNFTSIISGVQYRCFDGSEGPPPRPLTHTGFWVMRGANESSISQFRFVCQDEMIAGVIIWDDEESIERVIINNNEFYNGALGIYVTNVNECTITHNKIFGVASYGIQMSTVGSYPDVDSHKNKIAFNEIVSDFTGIYVYTWGARVFNETCLGPLSFSAATTSENKIIHNTINAYYGIYLRERYGWPTNPGNIQGNYIGFNDLQACNNPFRYNPTTIEGKNIISRNLVENRAIDVEPPEKLTPFNPVHWPDDFY